MPRARFMLIEHDHCKHDQRMSAVYFVAARHNQKIITRLSAAVRPSDAIREALNCV